MSDAERMWALQGRLPGTVMITDPDQRAWPIQWESDPHIDDGHAHLWERCCLALRGEMVIRCRHCHAPRCGHSNDTDPCMERRHHTGLHIHLSGRFRPLGDLLPSDGAA